MLRVADTLDGVTVGDVTPGALRVEVAGGAVVVKLRAVDEPLAVPPVVRARYDTTDSLFNTLRGVRKLVAAATVR
jgi:hypothetical protein